MIILLSTGLAIVLFLGTALASALLWRLLRRPVLRVMLCVAPFAAFLLAYAPLAFLFALPHLTQPSVKYAYVFPNPPQSVVIEHAGENGGWDYDEVFLALTASAADQAKLTDRALGFAPVTRSDGDIAPLPGGDIPDWFRVMSCTPRSSWVSHSLKNWQDVVVSRCGDDGRLYIQARDVE